MTDTYLCDPADIKWQGDTPYSNQYEDIYWNRSGVLREKQHVFIEPLMEQVKASSGGQQVTVCELGFGFGINCLLTAAQWRYMPQDCRLNLVSIENHPVARSALQQLLQQHDFAHADSLLQQYPLPYHGQHVIWLADNIRLLLVLNDVETALAGLDAAVDFWFLDGFAPSRNSTMWQASLYRKMFARSRPGAGVATYSAAGQVRRDLEGAGFSTQKRPGFAGKKEMLEAKGPGHWQAASHELSTVTIIGAGLAGLYCSEALQRRGLTPQIIDSGSGASQIPQLAVKPQLAVRTEARYRYSLMAFHYMKSSPGYHHSGLQWFARNDDEKMRLQKIADQFPDNIMCSRQDGTIDVAEAGWLSYKTLLSMLAAPITSDDIQGLTATADGWHLTGRDTDYMTEQVILATGANRQLLPPEIQVRAIHGQAVSIHTSDVKQIMNGDVSVLPTVAGRSVVSGTYARRDSLDADPDDTKTLLESAKRLVSFDRGEIEIHTGVRAVSRDRLPVLGAAPAWEKLSDARRLSDVNEHINGLYYCTAFGSRGATHARLSAEHLVAKMFYEPAALDLKQQQMLSPARFYLRDRAD